MELKDMGEHAPTRWAVINKQGKLVALFVKESTGSAYVRHVNKVTKRIARR